jgi:Protein of unknown function (DUF2505)
MPRSFDMSADYDGTVDEVHRAFSERDYWLARLAESGVDDSALESMRVSEGTIDVVTLQVVRSHNLPGLVTQLHRGDLCIRREENWGPIADGTATASIAGSILDAPVNLSGTAVLSSIAGSGGARVEFRVTVQVRIPIVGGKVEKLLGSVLTSLVAGEQRFTTTWIANNA